MRVLFSGIILALALLVASPAVAQDYATALRELKPLAEQGHPNAQRTLGGIYYFGEGVPKNYAEAANWYRKAAEQGELDSRVGLGRLYERDLGVLQDNVMAHMWFNLAVAHQFGASPDTSLYAHWLILANQNVRTPRDCYESFERLLDAAERVARTHNLVMDLEEVRNGFRSMLRRRAEAECQSNSLSLMDIAPLA